jgi:SpoVK/Ycf46/Vps4 family AAA+-type ATPase
MMIFFTQLYLFYGPTGTGKSRLMKKISQELKRPFIEISGSDIYTKWTGMSEKNVELVYRYCKKK